jgi:hypothetical protein
MVAPELDALDRERIERWIVLPTKIGETGGVSGAPRNIDRAGCNVFLAPKRIRESRSFDA